MKALGIAFILLSAFSVGSRISVGLKQQCRYLQCVIDALQIFENEIAVRCTPLPEAFSVMATAAQGSAQTIFLHVSDQMQQQRWTSPRSAMENALKSISENLIGDILLDLSDKLGKYDIDTQLAEIAYAKERVKRRLYDLESERKMKSKTYKTLSLCTGLAVVILLI